MMSTVSSISSSRYDAASASEAVRRTAPDNGQAAQQRRPAEKTTAKDELPSPTSGGGKRELTDEERLQVEELKRIDAHVRQHEAAHQAAAGGLARGKSFTYKQGPDGNQYAVAGEVQIDTSAVPNDPQATIAKMQRVRAAATAPSDPSSQDRAVAAQASRTEAEARAELLEPNEKEQQADGVSQQNTHGEITGTGIEKSEDSPALQRSNPYAAPSPIQPSYSSYNKEQGVFINAYA